MTKSKQNSDQDLIKLHWSTIFVEVCDQTVRSGLKDFEILELDQSPDPVQCTASVQFSGETSKETAIEMLQQIIEAIEKNGLPETTRKMSRKHGAMLTRIQEQVEQICNIAQKLPPDLRDRILSRLEHAGEPGFQHDAEGERNNE
jgi:hypothetical protein